MQEVLLMGIPAAAVSFAAAVRTSTAVLKVAKLSPTASAVATTATAVASTANSDWIDE